MGGEKIGSIDFGMSIVEGMELATMEGMETDG